MNIDKEIERVASDESQKDDWESLAHRNSYKEGFIDGAKWHRKKSQKSDSLPPVSETRHVCGLQGFNPMLGDSCEACDNSR
jgi:hypothetical protein